MCLPPQHFTISHLSISPERLAFVNMLSVLFKTCIPPSNPLLVGRIVKALLPSLSILLSSEVIKAASKDPEGVTAKRSGKQKQKASGFEDADVFKVNRERLCEGHDEGQLVLAVLDGTLFIHEVKCILT